MEKRGSCAIIGHSPMRFAWGYDEEDNTCGILKDVLMQHIQRLRVSGIRDFMVACDPGIGLWCAEIIIALRDQDTDLRLYCHTPCEEQSTKWAPYLRERYFNILGKCTYMTAEHTKKAPSAQADAYRTIIRQSDMVLAVYDICSLCGDAVDEAMEYARAENKPTILIHPDTFEMTSAFLKVKNDRYEFIF